MLNNLGMVTLVLLLLVATFTFITANSYYSNMRTNLETRASVDANSISMYRSRNEYVKAAKDYVDSFKDSSKIELQYVTPQGSVDCSSCSLTLAGSPANTPEVARAQSSKEIEYWIGKSTQTGERLLSVSSPLVYNGELVGTLRYVTSLRLVDQQVLFICGMSIAIATVILALIYFSNVYFVRSIVDPVVQITGIAKRIAAGSYGIQVERKPGDKVDDEIGDLTDAINDMSRSIKLAENMKSEFISSVSHELRTPLTAINGWAETIMNGETRDAADVRKGMGIIASEARRLTNMVEELLEFSRIEDGRFTLSVEPMDIKAELEDAVYTYREFFASEGIKLTHTDCDEEFPPLPGDPARLRQVFCNLLDNAAKHGGSGKKIDTAIFPQGNDVAITIRDYGPGIPKEELPHVKYKFYKGSSTARGSGIGLAVCEEIITRHDGSLTIENAEEGGCLVTIRLPLGT
jgi:signal transduction histidine kinase